MSRTLRNQLQRAMDEQGDEPQETPCSSFPAMLEAHAVDLRRAWYAMGRPWPVTLAEVMAQAKTDEGGIDDIALDL